MIDSILNNILGNIDPTILYICAAVLVICFILALIKKVISIVIICAILVFGCVYLVPQVKDYQANFYIEVNDSNELVIMVDGKELVLGGDTDDADEDEVIIEKVEMERQVSGEYTLKMIYSDGAIGWYTIPGFMRAPVIKYFDTVNMEYQLIE